ncbi:hypothetical protein ACFE04_017229 [Oxalis oulophora]
MQGQGVVVKDEAIQLELPNSNSTTTMAADLPKSRKRAAAAAAAAVDDVNTNYYKIRLIIKHLRPQILEVLRTPDFPNCKAGQGIRQELDVLRKLCKETPTVNNGVTQKPQSQLQDIKPQNGETLESYIVGGSAFGWNFITYSGNNAVYYGRTKEAFRISQPTQQES